MGIYDREYYRGEAGRSGLFGGATPVCKTLILINVAVYLFIALVGDKNPDVSELITDYLKASANGVLRHYRIWELLTATFLHASIWHLAGNMIFLWFVGREMESMYGTWDFLAFYLCAAVFSTLCWVLIDSVSAFPSTMVGASGAVIAVVMLFTLYYPKREILFLFIPMPMWALLLLVLVFPLVPGLNGGSAQVAVETHVAGVVFGFLFKHFDLRWSRLFSGRLARPRLKIFSSLPHEQTRTRTPNPSRTPASVASSGKSASVSVLPEEQLDARLDEVLAKIAREGRGGLTEEEQRVLQEASRRARIRRSDRI
jgi:membrane associated rhomboid family serine protease